MKKTMYALMENGNVKAVSATAMHGWKLITVDGGNPQMKTGYDKLVDKYRALCAAAPTEEAKNKVRQDFVEARKIYRAECAQRKAANKTKRYAWAAKKPSSPTTPKKPVLKYWELDNSYYDFKMGDYVPYLKKIIEATGDLDTPWKWVGHTYAEISKLDYYKDLLVTVRKGKITMAEAIAYHNTYHQQALAAHDIGDYDTYDKYKKACARLKHRIDTVLDAGSNRYKEQLSFSPERLVRMIENPIPDDDTIIACYPLEDKAYNGEVTAVDCGIYLVPAGVDFNTGETMYRWTTDDFVINTNSTAEFGSLMCDAKYGHLITVIAEAKAFGLTPRTVEGFYHREKGTKILNLGDGLVKEIPNGIRGMCITARAAAELQAMHNWYKGMAELGSDFSDEKVIHHEDGIQSKTITEYEYRKNREQYQDWRETERRDFQFELNYDEDQDQ